MKSVGIIRKVDDLGRIVLPAELRRTLDIAEQDAMEIYVDGASVVLRKYEETCIFCGSSQDILSYREKKCLSSLSSLPAVVGLIPTQRKFYQAFNI